MWLIRDHLQGFKAGASDELSLVWMMKELIADGCVQVHQRDFDRLADNISQNSSLPVVVSKDCLGFWPSVWCFFS